MIHYCHCILVICNLLLLEVMATTYVIECRFCLKNFKSFFTLKKHVVIKHPGTEWENIVPVFKDCKDSTIASLLESKDLSASDKFDNYKVWLAGLVERINSLFHPRLPGRWVRIDSHQVPTPFFQHLIFTLKAQVNSVQNRMHCGQPAYKTATQKISYKLFDSDSFFNALEEQGLVEVKDKLIFSGNSECHESSIELSADDLIKRAKMKATIPRVLRKRASSKSSLVVGYGQGRATREIELIWWPNLYSFTSHGRLIVRMFIEKSDF